MFKKALIGFGFISALGVGAIFILPSLVPTDSYRDKLETELSRALARDVSITGDIQISTFPAIEIEAGAVTLANPEGYGAENFLDVQAMTAKVRLWPLLRKQVEISRISLDQPNIWLERKTDGSVNWSVGDQAPADTANETKDPFKRDGRFTDYDPALDLLRIKDGQIRFIDAASNQDVAVKNINLDLKAPALDAALKLDGALTFDDLAISLDGELTSPLDFLNGQKTAFNGSISTDLGDIDINGAFRATDMFDFDATFDVKSSEPIALSKRLPLPDDIKVPDLNTVSAAGSVAFSAQMLKLSDLDVQAVGDDLNLQYTGTVDLSETPNAQGKFDASINDISILNGYLESPLQALNAVKAVKAAGGITWDGETFATSDVTANVDGPLLNMTFNGAAGFSDALNTDGTFNMTTPDAAKLVEIAGLSQADAAAVKRLTASGAIVMAGERITISSISAEAADGLVNGTFNGDVDYNGALNIKGRAEANIADLNALDSALPRDIPFSNIAKQINFSSDITSKDGTYFLSDTAAALDGGDVNGAFKGDVSFGTTSNIAGDLNIDVPSLRRLATKRDVILPADTDTGRIFQALALSGSVSGTPQKIRFKNGALSLDEISGNGDFDVSLITETPNLTGQMAFSALDLRPYMAAWSAQRPEGQIMPWSTNAINVSGLDAIDADLRVTAPSINLTRLELGETKARLTVKNGTLQTKLEKTELYGGQATGVFNLTSSGGQPKIDLSTQISSVKAQDFMQALGGFDKVTGTSNFTVNLNGGGQSQADIMRSLTGSGAYDAINGKLLGLDAAALLTGIDSAIASRQLPQGLGLGQTTDFNDVEGKFSISNGRVQLGTFQLQSGTLSMEGDGLIDLGGQAMDIGIRPKLNEGSDVASFGVPLRFSGSFGQAKAGLDTNMLTQIATAKARQSAGNKVKEQLGGPLGSILGGVIGGGRNTPEPQPDTPNETVPAAEPKAEDKESLEKTINPEEEVRKRLNNLFGKKKTPEKSE